MSSDSKDQQSKPILDREAFQQLLAAAFVLQQHNDRLSQENPGLPAALREIQLMAGRRDLDLRSALSLVAERLRKLSNASGVSICVIDDGSLRPLACAGSAAHVPGGAVAANSLVATEQLCNGRVFHCPDAEGDVRLDYALCRHARIGSLWAVAIPAEGGVAGLIELRSTSTNRFAEIEESGRWAAGFVRALLDRDAERAGPGLARPHQPEHTATQASQRPTLNGQTSECRVCGEALREDEAFCGHCSMPRFPAAGKENLQSKWASMWFMQRAKKVLSGRRTDEDEARLTEAASPAAAIHPLRVTPVVTEARVGAGALAVAHPAEPQEIWGPLRSAVERGKLASFARQTLDASERWLRSGWPRLPAKRLVLASAAVALALFIVEWSAPQLAFLLAELGLAQAVPHARAYSGNPEVRVWVDANTGLYYCPGSNLYGKTPGGHFARQRAAEQDEMEPATRMPCW